MNLAFQVLVLVVNIYSKIVIIDENKTEIEWYSGSRIESFVRASHSESVFTMNVIWETWKMLYERSFGEVMLNAEETKVTFSNFKSKHLYAEIR